MKRIIYLFPIVLLVFFSCNNQKEVLTETVLIYCDLSNSVTEESMTIVANKIESFVAEIDTGSKVQLFIYPIDDNIYSEPLVDTLLASVAEFTQNKDQQRRKKLQQEHRQIAAAVKQKLLEVYHMNMQQGSTGFQSCIINTLEVATRKLHHAPGVKKSLIYFSDMLEECPQVNGQRVYWCSPRIGNEAREEQLHELLPEPLNLQAEVGEHLYVVVTTGNDLSNDCITPQQKRQYWATLFGQVGFSADFVANMQFDSQIPHRTHGNH